MRRVLFFLLLATALPLRAQSDRGRPVILLVHGRGMLGRDTAGTRQLWFNGLKSGGATLTRSPLIEERDVRVVWYADVLDPSSSEACDYGREDPRARRAAKTDPGIRQVASIAGGLFGVISAIAGDKETGNEMRALAADAQFLGDARKRCASEARLGEALDRARNEERPVILIGHSLGSLVSYDYLSARTDTGLVQRLVTIGSPAGRPDMRALLIGGDTTDAFSIPRSVKDWVNIRNDRDGFAVPLAIGRDTVVTTPADEPDPHEMVGYLRGTVTAREVLGAWCSALKGNRPSGCKDIVPN